MKPEKPTNFYFDTILPEEEICNLSREKDLIISGIKKDQKLIVYGPRNFGKTSLIQSVIIPKFRKLFKDSFIFKVDLLEARSHQLISDRIRRAFEISFSESFPKKHLLELAKEMLRGFKPVLEVDPLTGLPTLTLGHKSESKEREWQDILLLIRDEISKKHNTLLIFDEFQDIHRVEGAQGEFRSILESFKNTPMILMGSKRHILSKIFALPNAPLAGFGVDISFGEIPYEEYQSYMNERFSSNDLHINLEVSSKLQDYMMRIPEPINIVCSDLLNSLSNTEITWEQVLSSVKRVVEGRTSRYHALLALFSTKEVELMKALARVEKVTHPTGISFLKEVNTTPRTVSKIIDRLLDVGIVEIRNDLTKDTAHKYYQISDPLFNIYLQRYA